MGLCLTMKSSPSGCPATPPGPPIIHHVAGWHRLYFDSAFDVPCLLAVRGWCYFALFAGPWRVALSNKKRSLNSIISCPMSSLIRIVGEGQRPTVRRALSLISLTCKSRCVSYQPSLVHYRNLIVAILDEAWDRLEDADDSKWLSRWVPGPFARYSTKFRFFKSQGSPCRSSSRLGGPEMLSPIEAVGWYNRLVT